MMRKKKYIANEFIQDKRQSNLKRKQNDSNKKITKSGVLVYMCAK